MKNIGKYKIQCIQRKGGRGGVFVIERVTHAFGNLKWPLHR